MLPVVIPVDEIPLVPQPAMLMGLRQMHDSLLEEQLDGDGHLAMALCRPGGPQVRGDDELWIDALRSTLDDGSVSLAGCFSEQPVSSAAPTTAAATTRRSPRRSRTAGE